MTTPEHLKPERSNRGFAFMPIIDGLTKHEVVRIYESSLATDASIWLRALAPKDRNDPDHCDLNDAVVELTLDAAAQLRDQLDWMIGNHYQVRAA